MSTVKELKAKIAKMKQYNDTLMKERNKAKMEVNKYPNIITYPPIHSSIITEHFTDRNDAVISVSVDIDEYLKNLLYDLDLYFSALG